VYFYFNVIIKEDLFWRLDYTILKKENLIVDKSRNIYTYIFMLEKSRLR